MACNCTPMDVDGCDLCREERERIMGRAPTKCECPDGDFRFCHGEVSRLLLQIRAMADAAYEVTCYPNDEAKRYALMALVQKEFTERGASEKRKHEVCKGCGDVHCTCWAHEKSTEDLK